MLFFQLLMGHVTGDYLLQPLSMALNKAPGKNNPVKTALMYSIPHCIIYSVSICLWLWTWDIVFFILIFFSHWVIDFFSLADRWLGIIKGRTLKQAVEDDGKYREFNIAFTSVVYTIVDNSFHLMLMFLILAAKGML